MVDKLAPVCICHTFCDRLPAGPRHNEAEVFGLDLTPGFLWETKDGVTRRGVLRWHRQQLRHVYVGLEVGKGAESVRGTLHLTVVVYLLNVESEVARKCRVQHSYGWCEACGEFWPGNGPIDMSH